MARSVSQAGCVVSVSPSPGAGSLPGGPWSGSGVLLGPAPGLVLCHGLIFSPFLREAERPSWTQRAALLADSFSPDMQIQVLRPGGSCSPRGLLRPGGDPQQGGLPALGLHPLSGGPESPVESRSARLLLLVPCRRFQEAFARVFEPSEQWRFGGEGEVEEEAGDELRFLHWFALLRLQEGGWPGAEGALSCGPAALLSKGDPLLACGSPFGSFCPDIFLNTLSKGIVSNLAGEGNALILTDARCLPGTEGGGIFAASPAGPQLVGLVVAPLCWKSNEWVGLTLVCALDCILDSIGDVLSGPHRFSKIQLPRLQLVAKTPKAGGGPVQQMLAAVVLLECGLSWGSGVMVSSSVVLTCRHVVSGASRVRVRIRPSPGQTLVTKGKVVFATQDASPYDVALVELDNSLSMFVEPALASRFSEGEDVSVVGFGAFGQACGPSVTSGILSAVITVEGKPVMLQATCAVHGGSSGGALFATRSGELLGIVASNTRDNSIGATYPHLNFSLPITVLQPALSEYTLSRDLRGFRELDWAAERVRVVWRLQREPGEVPLSKL